MHFFTVIGNKDEKITLFATKKFKIQSEGQKQKYINALKVEILQ